MKIKAMNRPGFHAATVSLLAKVPTWIWYWTGWRWRWTGRTGRGQHCHLFRPVDREPRGHPSLLDWGVCRGQVQHLDRTGKRTAVSILA